MSHHVGKRLLAQRDVMVLTASVMFGGATLVDLVEIAVPGGQRISLAPGIGALAFAGLILVLGERLPHWVMAALGPIGAALVGYGLATTRGAGDGAVLYMWPVLWESYFFGRRGAIAMVVSVAVVQAIALLAMPGSTTDLDRWLDVVSAVGVVAAVVQMFSASRHRLVSRIAAEARIDELTGLLNRRGFVERASVELARSRRDGTSLGAVAFDLDHFKSVNDQHGHQVGDRVLARFADCLHSEMRGTDLGGRLGGEEFVVLLPGADLARAQVFGERVRLALQSSGDRTPPLVTVSGGATAAVGARDIEGLLRSADMAMYAAKAQGRNRIVTRPARQATSV